MLKALVCYTMSKLGSQLDQFSTVISPVALLCYNTSKLGLELVNFLNVISSVAPHLCYTMSKQGSFLLCNIFCGSEIYRSSPIWSDSSVDLAVGTICHIYTYCRGVWGELVFLGSGFKSCKRSDIATALRIVNGMERKLHINIHLFIRPIINYVFILNKPSKTSEIIKSDSILKHRISVVVC